MRKRLTSLFLAMVMILNLTMPTVWAVDGEGAASSAVTNGTYDKETGTVWSEGGNGTLSYNPDENTTLNLSKTAAVVANNVFDITLRVEAITKTVANTSAAAVVLVIDVSGSMDYCADCGGDGEHDSDCVHYSFWDDDVTDTQTRMYAAKQAALQFLNGTDTVAGYAGTDANAARWLSIVKFSREGSVALDWVNVAGKTGTGYNQAVSTINGLSAGGGTNLDDGLYDANTQMAKNTVSGISSKSVVALTDGAPTYSRNRGNGQRGSAEINSDTAATATSLKGNSKLYTVCFGVANEYTYYGGPTVGNFLRDSIATAETTDEDGVKHTFAYNADNTAQLMAAFSAITEDITSGIEDIVVNDPMGDNVAVTTPSVDLPEGVTGSTSNLTWTLQNEAGTTNDDGTTTYVYTLTYRVTLDADAEGFDESAWHPANQNTVLQWSEDQSYQFPVPGLKGVTSRYTVTYAQGEHGALAGQDADGRVVHSEIKKHSATPAAPAVTPDEGYYFVGWDKEIAETVTEDVIYTAVYAPKGAVAIVANSDTKVYNGAEQQVSGYTVTGLPAGYTLEGVSAQAKGTNVGDYTNSIAGTPVIKDADGNDVTYQFTVSKQDGLLKINPLAVTVTITGNTASKVYTGSEQKVEGYTVSISNALYKESDFTFSGEAVAKGTDVGAYPMGLTVDQFKNNNSNFTVTFVVTDGKLTITPLGAVVVTITGNTGVKEYNGSQQKVEGYTVSISDPLYTVNDFVFSGTAIAQGTNVGTYKMGLAADQFANQNPNFENVTFVVNDGQLDITPVTVTVTITGNTDEKVYNGSEQKVEGYEVSISDPLYTVNDFVFSGAAVAKGTDVGTYKMGLAVDQFANKNPNFENVTFVVIDGQLDITPVDVVVTIIGNKDTLVYNGSQQKVEGYDVSINNALYTEDDFAFSGTAVAKGTNVGTYPMGLAADQFVNNNDNFTVTFAVTDGQLEITPLESVTVTITGNTDSKIYNGKEQSVSGYTVSIDNALYTENDFVFTGTDVAKGTDVGVYPMGLNVQQFQNTNGNFKDVTFVVNDGQLEITPASVTVTITGNTGSKVFNGAEQKVEGYEVSIDNALYTEGDFTFAGYDVAKGTDVGTYGMGLADTDFINNNENFTVTFVVIDGQLDITPASVTVTITGNKDVVKYNGSEQKVTGYQVSIDNALYTENDFAFSGTAVAKGTNVGTYPMGLSKDQFVNKNDNFTATFVVTDGQLDITPLDTIVVTITGNKDSVIYNGAEQKVEDYKVSINSDLYTEDDFVFTGSAIATGTNVGKYFMGLDATQFENKNSNFANVVFKVIDGELEITPAEVTVTITGNSDVKEYNGKEQTVEGYEVSIDNALYTESDFVFNGSAVAAGTNVGKYPMGLAADQFANQNGNFAVTFEVVDGQLEITPVDGVEVTIVGNSASKVFNGKEQSVSGYTVSISNALYTEDDFTFNGTDVAKGINVGKYPMGLAAEQFVNKSDNFTNVVFKVTDGQLEITPADVTVTITGNKDTLVYNGSEQKVEGYKVSIDNALYTENDFVFNGSAVAAGTNVGKYPMGLAVAQFENKNTNFNATFVVVDGQLEITPAEVTVTITGNSDVKEYNGSQQKVEGYEVSIDNALYTENDFAFNGSAVAAGTNVGTYPMGLAVAQFENKNTNFNATFVVVDGQLVITPVGAVVVTITGNSDVKEYNGSQQKVEGYQVSINNPLYTEDDFGFIGSAVAQGTNVGKYPMGLDAEQFVNKNSNFEDVVFLVTDGQLEITPAEVTVTITGNSDVKEYNGSEQKVEGYQVSVSDELYTENDFSFSGEAVAKGIYVGKYPMGLSEEQFANINDNFIVTFVVNDGQLEITPVKNQIVITADSNVKTYDGTALTDDGYSYNEALLVQGDYIVAVVEGSQLNVGASANKVVSYKILRGQSAARAVVDVTDCYSNVSVVDGTLTVNKRAVTLTSGSDSKVYDGTELKKEEVSVSGDGFVEGEGAVYSEFASITNVGSVPNTFTYTLNEGTSADNYEITVVEGVLTINKHTDAKLEASGYTGVYDGQEHDGVTDKQVTGAVEGDEWEYSYSVDGENYVAEMPQYQDVGTYTVYVKASNPNYEGDALITTVPVVITPATITVTADDKTMIAGDPDPELTYQVSTPVESETPVFDGLLVRDPGTAKGEYAIQQGTLVLADGEGFKSSNYVLEFVPGTLTILLRSISVEKTVDRDMVFVGEDITYTIVITNDGDVDLEDVLMVDEMLGISQSIGALAKGESKTFQFTYTATEDDWEETLYNTVVVTGDGGVSDEDTSDGTTVYVPIPDTGDHAPIELMFGAMLVSMAGILALLLKQRKELAE